MTDLRRQVESLLARELRAILGPRRVRVGHDGVLLVAYGAGRDEVEPGEVEPEPLPLIVEPGWTGWGGEPGYPLGMVLPPAWIAYLDGSGSVRPYTDGEEREWMIGPQTRASVACLAMQTTPVEEPVRYRYFWPDEARTPEDPYPPQHYPPQDIYLSTHYAGRIPNPVDDPTRFAGLAQLLVQSLLAVGRSLWGWMPAGWSPAPGTWGIVRMPPNWRGYPDQANFPFRWVLIRITPGHHDSMYLKIPESHQCLLHALSQGEYTGSTSDWDMGLAESVLLGSSQPDPTTYVDLDPGRQINQLLYQIGAGGGEPPINLEPMVPSIQWDWYQPDISIAEVLTGRPALAKGLCMLMGGDIGSADGGYTVVAMADFEHGVWQETISHWAIGGDSNTRIYFPTSGTTWERLRGTLGSVAFAGPNCIVYAHWNGNGGILDGGILEYEFSADAPASEPNTAIPSNWDLICGEGTANASSKTAVTVSKRGFTSKLMDSKNTVIGGTIISSVVTVSAGPELVIQGAYGQTNWWGVPNTPGSYQASLGGDCLGNAVYGGPIETENPYTFDFPDITITYLGLARLVYRRVVTTSATAASVLALGWFPRTAIQLVGRQFTYGAGSTGHVRQRTYTATGALAKVVEKSSAGATGKHMVQAMAYVGPIVSTETLTGPTSEIQGVIIYGGGAAYTSKDADDWSWLNGDSISGPGAVLASYNGTRFVVSPQPSDTSPCLACNLRGLMGVQHLRPMGFV